MPLTPVLYQLYEKWNQRGPEHEPPLRATDLRSCLGGNRPAGSASRWQHVLARRVPQLPDLIFPLFLIPHG
jgi:hypothetical protein